MPENSTYQRWYEHRLYLLVGVSGAIGASPSTITGPKLLNAKLSTFTDASDLETATGGQLVLFDKVRSLTVSSEPTRETITTRDEARGGFETQVDISSTVTKPFQVRYQRASIDTTSRLKVLTDEQAIIRSLLLAKSTGSGICAVDMDSGRQTGINTLTWDTAGTDLDGGALGIAANWSVAFNITKEVGSIVYADLTLTATEYPEYVEWSPSTGTGQFIEFTAP